MTASRASPTSIWPTLPGAASRFVDDEAGVVLGMAVFIRRAGSPVPRNAFSEWFWIEDGKIRNIWTAMYYPGPERPVPNWPPFDGNFPLPAGVIPARRRAQRPSPGPPRRPDPGVLARAA